jgi:hypothetical protein
MSELVLLIISLVGVGVVLYMYKDDIFKSGGSTTGGSSTSTTSTNSASTNSASTNRMQAQPVQTGCDLSGDLNVDSCSWLTQAQKDQILANRRA